MLVLNNIFKKYGDSTAQEVKALKGVSIAFRDCEFVSILGASGCGKTTLLNIIGGLDLPSSGDFILDGVPTSSFKEKDWDAYRNSEVGFVFQQYNLIKHLSVLSNVELALTLSGVSVEERTARAKEALGKVGLSDVLHKKPNELSGGQMQRVAIARAIVNEPKILLADEPTGAIDSETSVLIMDILKEISQSRLVIMVTHNTELAEQYSTRIVKLSDGEIISDSNSYTIETKIQEKPSRKKTRLNFFTTLKLSFSNLVSKKGRSLMTVIAGSIGIICIALILAVNNGFSTYIGNFEHQSISKYPITVTASGTSSDALEESMGQSSLSSKADIGTLLGLLFDDEKGMDKYSPEEIVHIYKQLTNILQLFIKQQEKESDISAFKAYVDENFDTSVADVKYDYALNLNIYVDRDGEYKKVNPVIESDAISSLMSLFPSGSDASARERTESAISNFSVWDEMIDETSIAAQYDVIKGCLPQNMNEIVLVVDEYNSISDFTAFALAKMGLSDLIMGLFSESLDEFDTEFDDIIGKEYYVLPTSAAYLYQTETGTYSPLETEEDVAQAIEENGITLSISGIIRPKEGVKGSVNGVIGYSSDLATYILQDAASSPIVSALTAAYNDFLAETKEEIINPLSGEAITKDEYNALLEKLNVRDVNKPYRIFFFPTSVENRSKVVSFTEREKSESYALSVAVEATSLKSLMRKLFLSDLQVV